jgi:ferredoxin
MLKDFQKYVSGRMMGEQTEVDHLFMTEKLKELTKYLGAVDVGIAKMQDYHFYSKLGRPLEEYNRVVTNSHKYGVVIAVEMDKEMINRAPQIEEMFEVTKGYVNSAVIALWIAYYIRALGYDARAHIDGNYEVVAPIVAQDAGMGQIGRNSILISPKVGQRLRLSVVTTDIPLVPDKKKDYGFNEFCMICKKCAECCPADAIVKDNKLLFKENNFIWKINQEKCFQMWQKIGTDCGICLSACPFSQEIDKNLLSKLSDTDNSNREKTIYSILDEYNLLYGKRNYRKSKIIK